MKVLVTGATGFLGSHLTELLIRDGVNVAAIMRPESDTWRIRELIPEMTCIAGDLNNLDANTTRIAEFSPDVIFHLGWSGVGNSWRNEVRQIDQNLLGTVTLARFAREIGCQAFIGIGSQAEYGPCQNSIDETTSTNPTTLYGAAKLSAYHLCNATLRESAVRFAWMRLFSSYGPKDNPEWMLPGLINTLNEGRQPALTRGEQRWDYIYVTDVARAIYQVAACPGAAGVFNLGSGQAQPLRLIIEQVRDMIDPSLPLGFGEVPYRPDQVMYLEANISKLHNVTGWLPKTDLAEGLSNTVRWYTSQRQTERAVA